MKEHACIKFVLIIKGSSEKSQKKSAGIKILEFCSSAPQTCNLGPVTRSLSLSAYLKENFFSCSFNKAILKSE